MPKKSTYRSDSFYSGTGVREFYLDLWPGDVIIGTKGDTTKEIPLKYDRRPDLWAHELYGSSNYWWVFAIKNKNILIDPVEDFKAGVSIIVPSKAGLKSLL